MLHLNIQLLVTCMVCALASKYTTTLWGSFWCFILNVFTQMLEIVSTERGAYPILIGVWPYFKNHFGRGYVFIEQKFIRCLFLLWISRTMRLRKFVEIQWKQSSLLLVLSQQVVPWWFNKKGPISKNNIQFIYVAVSIRTIIPVRTHI